MFQPNDQIWIPGRMYLTGDRVVYGDEKYVVTTNHYSSLQATPNNKDNWYKLF